MMARLRTEGLAALACAAGVAAAAEEPIAKIDRETRQTVFAGQGSGQLFAELDQNGDGYLSRDEAAFDIELRRRFHAVDRDADNQVDAEEYMAFHRAELTRPIDGAVAGDETQ